ncbi:hypothetical protein [Amaricoccus tamworthensis]|uniref:hypothetical protein n=1 Tax=Amaricoccus tamworthensis TaxID=57002 RepID=UPI003C7A3770
MEPVNRRSFVRAMSLGGGTVAVGTFAGATKALAETEETGSAGTGVRHAPLTEWMRTDPALRTGQFAVAVAENGRMEVKLGDGRPWSATPPLADPFQFADIRALVSAGWLTVGDIAITEGRGSAGDGGGARWHIESGGGADGFCRLALTNGLFARLAYGTLYDVRQAGALPGTDGAEVARSILSLTHHAIAGGGGTIEIAHRIGCHNIIFPPIPQEASVTFRMTPGALVTPTDPQTGTFMWDFPRGDWNTYPNFVNIRVFGDRDKRPVCNGIRVGPTNGMTIDNCFGQFIAGCAWQIEGANNSRIDIVTYKCGTVDGVYAQNYTANASKDNSFNDIVLQGSTEQDFHGINLEGAAVVREGSSLKLHGGPEVIRALRIHRCSSFALRVYTTFQWTGDGFIHVSDAGSSDHEKLLVETETQSRNTRGTLEIDTLYNVQWAGTGAADWCVIDLQNAASFLVVKGRIDRQATPVEADTDYCHFRIAGPGNNGVTLDFDGLRFAGNVDRARRLRDERDLHVRQRNHALAPTARAAAPPVLEEADVLGGRLALKGASFVDFVPEKMTELRDFVMETGQFCTIMAPYGKVSVRNTKSVILAGSRNFTMGRGATLTLYCAGPDRIVEIARSTR